VAKVTVWLKELRTEFLTASVVPVLLATAVSRYETGAFDSLLFALTLAGIVFLHLGTNVANDYFDHLSKNDILNVRYVRPFTGGSRLIQEGLISPRTVLVTSISFFVAAMVIGIILTVMRGPLVLAFGLVGMISGFFYTAPPLCFAHRGIGEFLVGINFGLLTVIATYYVQTGSISSGCIVASLPLTFLIASVIIINEFQDSEADARVGKRTLVVRLGLRRAVTLYAVVSLLGYLPILLGTATGLLPPLTLIGMATLPLIVKAIITARLYYNESKKLVPANASTILSHMLTGLLIAAGYIISIGD
jgi:1,4-dihydroxy-2-naphthoate octaprenyltransferase